MLKISYECFQNLGYPTMDGENNGKNLLKWMIWGYTYFWKHPYVMVVFHPMSSQKKTHRFPWPLASKLDDGKTPHKFMRSSISNNTGFHCCLAPPWSRLIR